MNVGVSPVLSLSAVICGLRGAVAAWGGMGWLGVALVLLVHRRLGEILVRMERMAARFQAGTLRTGGSRPAAGAGVVSRQAGEWVWPRSFGWLVKAASWQAAGFGSQLRAVLETPEMVALLVAAPQAVRVLRPLCRMLAIETSVLRPGLANAPAAAVDTVNAKRVRAPRVKPDLGRVPIPRGVMAAVRRRGLRNGF